MMRLLFLIFLAFTQLGYSQITNGDTKSNETSIYDGTIGSFPIHMELTNQSGQIIGWYDYPGKSTKLRIEGTLNSDGSIVFNEYNYKAQHTGHFSGYISDDQSISGQWNNPDLTKNLSFSLNLTNNIPLIAELDKESEQKMFQDSKVKGFSWFSLIISALLIIALIITFYALKNSKVKAKKEKEEILKVAKEKEEILKSTQNTTINIINSNGKSNEKTHLKELSEAFEDYMASKLNQNEFITIIGRSADKPVDGKYTLEDSYPDIRLKFQLGNKEPIKIAVECKYKTGFNDNSELKITKDLAQLNRYKEFAKEMDSVVFIALGIGDPRNPDDLFIIPLDVIKDVTIKKSDISYYKITKSTLFYNSDKKCFNR